MRTRILNSLALHRLVQAIRRVQAWFQRPRPSAPLHPPSLGGAGGGPPAHITIGTTVIHPQPQRFGVNVEVFDYEPWNRTAALFNTWTADGGMEPIILRYKGTATGGSATCIENDADLTPAVGETLSDGFFDGAAVRVYRSSEGRVHLLRTATVARSLASPTAGHRLLLDQEDSPIQAGDIYILSLIRDDAPHEALYPSRADLAAADLWRVYPNWGDNGWVAKQRDRDAAPTQASRTSLRVTLHAPQEGGLLQFIAGAPQQHRLNAFTPGQTYRLDLWLKQAGLPNGQVRVWLFPYRESVTHTFTVTGDWAPYSFSFKGPRRIPSDGLAQLHITARGPGTFWVDNVRLYAADQPPYALRPEAMQALQDFQPGTLRIWSGQTNRAWGTTLDNWLAPEGEGLRFWSPERGPAPGALFSLPTGLGVARSIGANPWLIVSPAFDETEWLNLLEYLAGPPDTPYGARRAASGQGRPWTDEFDHLYIEYGNETWNDMFQPWTFESGAQYGQFAEYFFRIAQTSPYYTAIAAKISFVVGGFLLKPGLTGYGAHTRKASPSTSMVAFAPYLSGWDRVQIAAETEEEQFQHTLLYSPWVLGYLTDQHVATRNLLTKMGLPFTLAASEGGPEYRLPSPGQAFIPEEEMFAKSLAAGVSALDSLLYTTAKGFGPQAYHAFAVGYQWSSHTMWSQGFRPHPAWLALQMRNRYVRGAMVETTVTDGPTISLPELRNRRVKMPPRPDLSLIGAYAFREPGRTSVFVLSRRLSEATPVTLHLPDTPSRATLYTLTGDPRANNLDKMRVQIREYVIKHMAQDYSFTMPPGSVYLFVIDTQ